jgi:hypothetical protein
MAGLGALSGGGRLHMIILPTHAADFLSENKKRYQERQESTMHYMKDMNHGHVSIRLHIGYKLILEFVGPQPIFSSKSKGIHL